MTEAKNLEQLRNGFAHLSDENKKYILAIAKALAFAQHLYSTKIELSPVIIEKK